jgi:single-strand DNA-binding protein
MINKVILLGNLGKDPELRRLESGSTVVRFPMATNENYKDRNGDWQTKTEWHTIVAWGPLAERAERSLSKGTLVYVEGKLNTRKYTDKEGVEKYSTDIVAGLIRIVDRKDQSNREDEFDRSSGSSGEQDSSGGQKPGIEKTSEDDLPF